MSNEMSNELIARNEAEKGNVEKCIGRYRAIRQLESSPLPGETLGSPRNEGLKAANVDTFLDVIRVLQGDVAVGMYLNNCIGPSVGWLEFVCGANCVGLEHFFTNFPIMLVPFLVGVQETFVDSPLFKLLERQEISDEWNSQEHVSLKGHGAGCGIG